ncbi:hypothetical protein [Crocosphaera sp.]|uniref:hypothetical protein n=1 Tax=Crocosphaera sp. TaxID=2729996 RepID=UPI003F26FE2A|nr:hypothetical protein [Crocosphaera sp.]
MINLGQIIFGAIAGAIVTLILAYIANSIQSNGAYRRELMRWAIETAHKDFTADNERYNSSQSENLHPWPMSSYIHYHYKFINLLDEGNLNEQTLKELLTLQKKLLETYTEFNLPKYFKRGYEESDFK